MSDLRSPFLGPRIYVGQTRKCPTCKGTGINPLAYWMVCPKCNGERTVQR